jgi:hypothetical protein
MRTSALTLSLLLLVLGAVASDKNPADYTLTAHILGTAKHHNKGRQVSTYNAQTGNWSYGTAQGSTERQTELRIANMIYVVDRICKEAEVGKDYPAMLDKKRIHLLLPDGKTCDARIDAAHEAQ